jgi:pimeloyl-ACP methyl ester carboxylesterase/DNA-binding CsgD family transcriptional regulator
MVPGWFCHVEELWSHPAAATARAKFAAARQFIWYDRLGCGLSDREGFEISIENDVAQLKAVLDAAGVEQSDILAYSFGGPPSVVFAARHPERVRRLVLYATYACGEQLGSLEAHESLKALLRANWGLGARTFAALFLPNGSAQDIRWFASFQRRATAPQMAADLLDYLRTQDVRAELGNIRVPTLVLANRMDSVIPQRSARELAANIPGAVLHLLEGNEHDPFIRDSGGVVEAILDFVDGRPLSQAVEPEPAPAGQELTPREQEVLRLIAAGESNKSIARELGIQVPTVERHVSNIYGKLGARGRADAALMALALKIARLP